jgi:hypothetical protein
MQVSLHNWPNTDDLNFGDTCRLTCLQWQSRGFPHVPHCDLAFIQACPIVLTWSDSFQAGVQAHFCLHLLHVSALTSQLTSILCKGHEHLSTVLVPPEVSVLITLRVGTLQGQQQQLCVRSGMTKARDR